MILRPILFSTPMVQAILSGRKTMTRRIWRNPYHPLLEAIPCDCSPTEGLIEIEFQKDLIALNGKFIESLKGQRRWLGCPHGVPGDGLWVRETWLFQDRIYIGYKYKADLSDEAAKIVRWKPSIYMPKAACRINLEIKQIRFERLNAISKADAISEGIKVIRERNPLPLVYKNYADKKEDSGYYDPRMSFFSLWDSIHGFGAVELNPWVWVIEFDKI